MCEKKALFVYNGIFTETSFTALTAARQDVTKLTALLKQDYVGFKEENIDVLANPGLVDFRTAVYRFFNNADKDDFLFFYYAGHGIRARNGELFLALRNTTLDAFSAQALEASFLRECIENTLAKKILVLLDCCHAGAFREHGRYIAREAPFDAGLLRSNFMPEGSGTYIMGASQSGQSAFETVGEDAKAYSLYTKQFIDAVETGEAAPDKDIITISDIHAYIRRQRKADGIITDPILDTINAGDELEFCLNPKNQVEGPVTTEPVIAVTPATIDEKEELPAEDEPVVPREQPVEPTVAVKQTQIPVKPIEPAGIQKNGVSRSKATLKSGHGPVGKKMSIGHISTTAIMAGGAGLYLMLPVTDPVPSPLKPTQEYTTPSETGLEQMETGLVDDGIIIHPSEVDPLESKDDFSGPMVEPVMTENSDSIPTLVEIGPLETRGLITSNAISPDGTKLFLGHENGLIQIIGLPKSPEKIQSDIPIPIHTLKYSQDYTIVKLTISNDGSRLVAGDNYGGNNIWDLTGNISFIGGVTNSKTANSEQAISQNGQNVAITVSEEIPNVVRIIDSISGRVIHKVNMSRRPNFGVSSLEFFPSSNTQLAMSVSTGNIQVWNAELNEHQGDFRAQTNLSKVGGIKFNGQGNRLFAISNGEIFMWPADAYLTGQMGLEIHKFTWFVDQYYDSDFSVSDDGEYFAHFDRQSLTVKSADGRKRVFYQKFSGSGPHAAAFLPGSKTLIVVADSTIYSLKIR